MDAPELDIKKCVWCGTSNPASNRACSKCEAVLSSAQPSIATQTSESTAPTRVEETSAVNQDVVTPLVESSPPNVMISQRIVSLGLGPRFESGQIRTYIVVGLFSIFLLLSLFAVLVDTLQIELVSKAAAGKIISQPEFIENYAMSAFVRLLLTVIVLFTAIAFLVWIYRAHQNLKALGAMDLDYSPGWAIAWFWIPILNLFRPYQVVSEIWKASGPQASRSMGTAWRYEETPFFIGLWWGSWLLSRFLNSSRVFMAFGDNEADPLLAAARWAIVEDVVSIASAVLAIVVVLKINARQESTNQINSARALEDVAKPSLAGDQL